ncbi:hypothetical protein E2C01_004542 [Portunus trituberculatus]|uniref:Uncharacterized protein n=1 Tax=Portunus trituberculatus TaxID=210409 RepID=A0A5B7CQ06_PORTR|nr:hypothetical protein [Portunus trituberculatus]
MDVVRHGFKDARMKRGLFFCTLEPPHPPCHPPLPPPHAVNARPPSSPEPLDNGRWERKI